MTPVVRKLVSKITWGYYEALNALVVRYHNSKVTVKSSWFLPEYSASITISSIILMLLDNSSLNYKCEM